MTQNNNQEGDEKDLNKDDDQSGEGDHSQNGGDDENKDDEVVSIKKSELEKIKSDRDNYKQATLSKKTSERKLGKQDDGGEEDKKVVPSATIDIDTVKTAAREVFQEAQGQTEKENEKEALDKLVELHPEYKDDSAYNDLMSDFASKRGKRKVENIMKDLEDAVLLNKKRTGKLDEYLNSERERGKQEGRTEGQISNAMNAGSVGDRSNAGRPSTTKLSPEGERMARNMGIDPKEAGKIDIHKDNVISKI